MAALSPTSLVRSSLEEMLENIRRRNEKTKDMPPVLPSRPTSRARLPSARRSLPTNFRISEKATASDGKEAKRTSDVDVFKRLNAFGRKKNRSDQVCDDSPYSGWDSQEATAGQRSGDLSAVASTSRSIVVRDDNIEYFFKKKLRVWCRLSSGRWDSGTMQSMSDEFVSVGLSTGNVVKVVREDLLPANPNILDAVDDLTQLGYLNEPSILRNLQHRYLNNMIYSKAGPVLIAVNPLKDMEIYGANYISSYSKTQMRAPHVYAVAEAAYDKMMKAGANQSILISGVSGAGKTETAKIAMQYLACVGGGGDGVESKMLQTSRILEAFGNAKTSRNDNSSRFGKLIEIQFSTTGKICGAVIRTFLLEKSRVVHRAKGERSYHIFYQLCDGASSVLRDKLNIKTASDYYYLNQGSCLTIGGVDDADGYQKLMEALNILRVSKEEQESFLSVLASILWLGNIKFEVIDNENHVQVVIDEAATNAAKLMECSVQDLMQVLSINSVKADNISFAKKLTLQEAMETRDALAKFIYASLFDWLIDQINKSLAFDKCCSGRAINILDMYGFEALQRNSFEQLCINYTNERLQQHFNRHLFKLEQEDYEADEVGWTKVDFEDNQDCLNLFEKKQQGLLSLLDEESYFPNATDLTFADKLKLHLTSNMCFKAEGDGKFNIRHCAGEVLYDTTGFLEKNRDMLPSESILTLLSCSSPLLQSFAFSALNQCQESLNAAQYGMLDIQKRSVGIKFKDHMYRLMQCLESTTPHFICCIKPNHKQVPGMYEMDLVAQQLKSFGILEVVRIARSGYPSRISHHEFAQRYGFLLLDRKAPEDPLSISLAVLQQLNIPPETYHVGYMTLYFRTVQVGGVESTRKRILQSVIGLQKRFRGYKARRQYHEVRAVVNLQSYIRGEISRRKYNPFSKKNKAGAHSQKHKHKHTHSVPKADDQQKSVVQLQSAIRGALARRQAHDMQSQNHDVNSTQNDNHDSASASDELNGQDEKAEAATLARQKEENAALKVQLQQYENRLAEYEVKMSSLEEMWQKQVKSLQESLTTAKSSLAPPDNASDQAGKLTYSPSPSPRYLDSDNSSSFDRTPRAITPFTSSSSPALEASGVEEPNGTSNPVSQLGRELEQRRQGFDEDAKALLEANRPGANPDEEFQRLKMRFMIWKKEYKNRLRETKGMMHKQGNAEPERKARRWWGKLSQKRA